MLPTYTYLWAPEYARHTDAWVDKVIDVVKHSNRNILPHMSGLARLMSVKVTTTVKIITGAWALCKQKIIPRITYSSFSYGHIYTICQRLTTYRYD